MEAWDLEFGISLRMFDFEKLEVYQVVKSQNLKVLTFISKSNLIDIYVKDQWKRASLSIMLNLAEGTGRMSVQDKKHFYTTARGSVFECAAILDIVHEMEQIDNEFYQDIYNGYEQASKMLLAMYRSMERQQ
jgi:four helix bundle protein